MGTQGLVRYNQGKRTAAQARFLEAVALPHLDDAIAHYGGTRSTFWRMAKFMGAQAELHEKYDTDLEERRVASFRRNLEAGNSKRRAAREAALADLIEDCEFLADTGEHPENAAKRLGYSFLTIEKRLGSAGRHDIIARLLANDRAHSTTTGPTNSYITKPWR